MPIKRNFNPKTFVEMVSDYAYIFFDDLVQVQSRKLLKARLFDEYIPRIFAGDLAVLQTELRQYQARSIFIIYCPAQTTVNPSDYVQFQGLDVQFVSDEQMNAVLNRIVDNTNNILTQVKMAEGEQFQKLYSQRQKYIQYYTSQQYFQQYMLGNYQLNDKISAHTKTMVQNTLNSLCQRIEQLSKKAAAIDQPKMILKIQDFNNNFCKKDLEHLEQKQPVVNPHCLIVFNQQLNYYPIQPYLPLCDNPTNPFFYLNEVRESYMQPRKVEQLPMGRLMIRGNSIQYPSCILQDQQMCKVVDELTLRYKHYEEAMRRAVYFVCTQILENTTYTKSVYQQILNTYPEIQGRLQEVVYGPQDDSTPSTWHVQNYNDIYDFDEASAINIHAEKNTFQDIFDTYSYNCTKHHCNKQTIEVPVKDGQSYYINPVQRTRTMYQTIQVMTVMIQSYLSSTSKQVMLQQQFIRRPLNHIMVFNEQLTLKDIFIQVQHLDVLNSLAQDGDERERLSDYVHNIKYQRNHTQQGSKLLEDTSPGDCGVCQCHYDNYKQHINSLDHIKAFKKMLQLDNDMDKEIMRQMKISLTKQAIQTQLLHQACQLAVQHNVSFRTAGQAVNEAIRAVNCQQQLDIDDPPRCNSPTAQLQTIQRWSDAVYLKRTKFLETSLSGNVVRKQAMKRIKGTSYNSSLLIQSNLKSELGRIAQDELDRILDRRRQSLDSENVIYSEGRVAIKVDSKCRYQYNQTRYEMIEQVALITILLRECCNMQLIHEATERQLLWQEGEPQTMYGEATMYSRRQLQLLYPEVDGAPYDAELDKMHGLYEHYGKDKLQQLQADRTVLINFKALRQEISDVEVGYAPRTDQLINIYAHISGQPSTAALLARAADYFQANKLFILNKEMYYYVKQHLENGRAFAREEVFAGMQFNIDSIGRIQLPRFYGVGRAAAAVRGRGLRGALPPCCGAGGSGSGRLYRREEYDALPYQTVSQALKDQMALARCARGNGLLERIDGYIPHGVPERFVADELGRCQYRRALMAVLVRMHHECGADLLRDILSVDSAGAQGRCKPPSCAAALGSGGDARSGSCPARRADRMARWGLPPRSNSVCGPHSHWLSADQVSMLLLRGPDGQRPVLTARQVVCNQTNYSAKLDSQVPSTQLVHNRALGRKYDALVRVNTQLAQNSINEQRLMNRNLLWLEGRHLIAAPIASGAEQFSIPRGHSVTFMNLTTQQLNAVYSALLGSQGFFLYGVQNRIFQKLTEIMYGTSASISTVVNTVSGQLNTIDVMSQVMISLSAENKLLNDSLQWQVDSRTVKRCIPSDLLDLEEDNPQTDGDIEVIRNDKISATQCLDDFELQLYNTQKDHEG